MPRTKTWEDTLKVGDLVIKTKGDYSFRGEIVAKFKKRSGAVRFVIEDDRGLLLIMNILQLTQEE
jgi:hypothetical protein